MKLFDCTTCLLILVLYVAAGNAAENEPTGCSYSKRKLVCDYARWDPPISDSDLSNTNANLLHKVVVENVDGAIPTQAFNGLDGPMVVRGETFIKFECASQDIYLGVNTFTSNLDWVQSLYINLCYIQSGLPSDVFERLTGLKNLEIVGGGIPGSIHVDSLAGLESLTDLTINADFPDNMLKSGFLSGVPNVENIDLKSSGLTNVSDDAFSGLFAIKTLDMSSNALKVMPERILDGMVVLETLDISANALVNIPQDLFKYTFSLKSLNISRNAITSLPTGVFDSLISLQTLDLFENSLQTVPSGIFDSTIALEMIDVSQNSLDFLPGGLFNSLVSLHTLDLTDNALTKLPENLFNPLISATSLSLTDNQWDCSTCDLLWLSTWSFYAGVDHSVVCATPSVYNGTVLERALLSLNCQSGSLSAATYSSLETTQTSTSVTETATMTSTTATDSSSTTTGSSTSKIESSSSSPTLWETVAISVSGVAILLSGLVGTFIAYKAVKKRLRRNSVMPVPVRFNHDARCSPDQQLRCIFCEDHKVLGTCRCMTR